MQASLEEMRLEVEGERRQRIHFHEEAMRLWATQRQQQTLMPRLAQELAVTRKTLSQEALEARDSGAAQTKSLEESLRKESAEARLAKEALEVSEAADVRASEELVEALGINDEL